MRNLSLPLLLTICILSSLATISCMVMMLTFGQLFYYGLALILIITNIVGIVKLNQAYPDNHKIAKIVTFVLMLLAVLVFAYPLLVVAMVSLTLDIPFKFSDLTMQAMVAIGV